MPSGDRLARYWDSIIRIRGVYLSVNKDDRIMTGNHNSGRKPRYLTVQLFEEWRDNHFEHLKNDVRWLKYIGWGIFLAVIANLMVDSFLR